MTPPKRLALLVALVTLFVVAGSASAAPTSDPTGDVVDRSPCECSNYNQDLKSIDATQSGTDVTFAITQYGSMNNAFAAAYYGPQVAIFTGGSATPTYGIVPRNDGTNNWKMTLVPSSGFTAPCPGSSATFGQGVTSSYDAQFTSATYTIHLADIGSPSSFQWKVANPSVPNCGVAPDSSATDIAPDSGLLTFTATGSTPPPDNNPPPPPPPADNNPPPPAAPPALTPAQTLPSLSGVPGTQPLGGSVGGTINLAGPASTVTFDLLAPGGGAATAAAQKLVGHLVKKNVAAGPLKFKIVLKKAVLKKLQKSRSPKLTLRVTVVLANGQKVVRKTTIKLKKKSKRTAPSNGPITYG